MKEKISVLWAMHFMVKILNLGNNQVMGDSKVAINWVNGKV
jgi:hypothetical protein